MLSPVLRRSAGALLASCALVLVESSLAQQADHVRRIAVLHPTRPCPPSPVFLESLAKLGWVEGRNLVIDCVSLAGRLQDASFVAAELISRRPEVVASASSPAARALKSATSTIPIVMWAFGDPVREGLIEKLSRPGGNLTGLTDSIIDMQVKRLEFLREMVPRMQRLAVVSWQGAGAQYINAVEEEVRRTAEQYKFTYEWFFPGRADDYEPLFKKLADARFDAVFLVPNALVDANQALVGKLAAAASLPTVSGGVGFAEAGGLLSFRINYDYNVRRAAGYVDQILKGASPALLPVEEPSEFILTINATAARKLGIKVPQTLLLRATAVIE